VIPDLDRGTLLTFIDRLAYVFSLPSPTGICVRLLLTRFGYQNYTTDSTSTAQIVYSFVECCINVAYFVGWLYTIHLTRTNVFEVRDWVCVTRAGRTWAVLFAYFASGLTFSYVSLFLLWFYPHLELDSQCHLASPYLSKYRLLLFLVFLVVSASNTTLCGLTKYGEGGDLYILS